MSFDPKNCALGPDCTCSADNEYWACTNWGRSTLASPALNHTEQHYTGRSKDMIRKRADERKRKHDKWSKETNERLGNERASNQIRNLQKKGIKI